MTRDERLLLAEISRWRRKEGWVKTHAGSYRSLDRNAEVDLWPRWSDGQPIRLTVVRRGLGNTDHDLASVAEAVGLLCVLDVLPADQFSPQYRAGYDAGVRRVTEVWRSVDEARQATRSRCDGA